MPDILEKRPQFEASINQFETEEGDINGIMHIAIGGTDIERSKEVLSTLLETLDIDVNLIVPKIVVRHIIEERVKDEVALAHGDKPLAEEEFKEAVRRGVHNQLVDLEERQLLIPNNDDYEFNAILKDKKLIVNNNEISLTF